jgi:hypothetical protein
MRAMSRSVSQLSVALALLALFAAPVARAALELGRGAHSCCPEKRAPLPASDEPCQQIAPTSCCHEIGVPPGASADQAPPVPALGLAAPPDPAPAAPDRLPRAVRTEADGPPLPPLLQSGVLLI